ncbi:MAG: polysaccharide deacetylase family protein [Bacteroidetes bacterium]|nr:polysaccharide deacetylase family protein [Bacteroidota bacterium]MBP6314509.1 polysaccharide deacetylase family protein [Chitinophagaceae bacterium]
MKFKIVSIAFLIITLTLLFFIVREQASVWLLVLLFVVYIHLLVLGSIFIQWNFYIKSIHSVSEFLPEAPIHHHTKKICLTFDDGIHPVHTATTLQILRNKNVKAHFFVIGKNIEGNEQLLKEMYQDGHQIGNHSFNHSWNFDLRSSTDMQKEIEDTNKSIQAVTGVKPQIFRPPYGVTNPNLAKAIQKTNMLSMGWNLRSMDTVAKSSEMLLQKLIKKTRSNSIILLHDRCEITVEVLTQYIDYCLTEGFTFVTLKCPNEA